MLEDPNHRLIEVRDLKTHFFTEEGVSRAVDGVSFAISRGKTLGLVGESGCGKSVTALSLLGLVPHPPGRIVAGSVLFEGKDLVRFSEKEMQKIRGNRISMIFQEPMSSLNPVLTIGDQVSEVFRIHQGHSQKTARLRALDMLDGVRIPDVDKCAGQYPHELSGGMRQRVMIAMALACNPDLLIADEPTTALDVTVQAQILYLMDELMRKYQSSVLLISHNLGVIAGIADDVAVMYAGMIVEQASAESLFAVPLHPYTLGLLRSIPKLEDISGGRNLVPIPGTVPDPIHYPSGCRFHPRCPRAIPECSASLPDLLPLGDDKKHLVRCIHFQEGEPSYEKRKG